MVAAAKFETFTTMDPGLTLLRLMHFEKVEVPQMIRVTVGLDSPTLVPEVFLDFSSRKRKQARVGQPVLSYFVCIKAQVAQARNMSIGEHPYCCVTLTSKYKDL